MKELHIEGENVNIYDKGQPAETNASVCTAAVDGESPSADL